ncbi:O-methyltransferase [Ornithinibacillus bavariensis]|uniref:Caffeoyl-CoA O-methyltransferase n=1 Tax=Ornithinibacillus bavariensis TaxID=545502 RepID=A0A920C4A6_9BACI|nr:O-methyltransferase [Ornithinibacillus bavariensis]GIO25420.1 caffeoyl-CoA O-methyltransferase [Ornithinibacillus bavariensis]
MDTSIERLLNELESFGLENDINVKEDSPKMKNITKDTGQFLSLLIKSSKVKNVLEIGTSNGYSTIWIAKNFINSDAHVTTVEIDDRKIVMARANFRRANLEKYVTSHHEDAGAFLKRQANETFDFIFLDSDRSHYIDWWEDLNRVLQRNSLMIVDNANSHREEVADFIKLIQSSESHDSLIVSVGKGVFIIHKN